MTLLSASGLRQAFGAVDIFAGLSLSVPDGGKIGLVGPNGIGKTTLLLVLAGVLPPSAGTVHVARRTQIGYLPQEAVRAFSDTGGTVYQEMLRVFEPLRQKEAKLRQLEADMAAGDESDALIEQYGRMLESFEMAGGYEYELRIQQTLDGLGFDRESRHMPLRHLSGGQKTRALLARLLLEKPDLLILDEPTNHLDIEAVQWLESVLRSWEGAVLIVSHDRYFLDRVVDRIWEMSRDRIEIYRGNYSQYAQQRQERWERRLAEFEAFKGRMEKELDYIRKNIASQNTLQAKGKLKRISRELKAVQVGGLQAVQGKKWSQTMDEIDISSADWGVADVTEAIRSLQPPSGRPPRFNIHMPAGQRSGNVVLRTQELVIGYPGNLLFTVDDIEMWREECAALIGPNGAGKTTFLRTILGDHAQLSGDLTLGASLDLGYFAQAHEQLRPDQQVLDEFLSHHPMQLSEARQFLAHYLFRGDDVFKLVGDLSGGERGRLSLAILALQHANFLLLDEPTNHLDIPAQEMLQEVLEDYDGTILLVSHDRYLIDRLATQIWHLDQGRLRVFRGPYRAYLESQDARHSGNRTEAEPAADTVVVPPDKGRDNGLSKNAQRQRQEELERLENRVHQTEDHLEQLSHALQEATVEQAFDKIQTLSIEYAEAQTRLAQLMHEWEKFASDAH